MQFSEYLPVPLLAGQFGERVEVGKTVRGGTVQAIEVTPLGVLVTLTGSVQWLATENGWGRVAELPAADDRGNLALARNQKGKR